MSQRNEAKKRLYMFISELMDEGCENFSVETTKGMFRVRHLDSCLGTFVWKRFKYKEQTDER
jgi:hypothetical protein